MIQTKLPRSAGARIEGLFMRVPQAMSNQGILARYFEQLADRGQGRLTMQANADESYQGILDLANRVDAAALVDLASVYRRGEAKPRYSNTLDNAGNWASPPLLRQSLETERTRPWTDVESSGFVATQLRLREASRDLGGEWLSRLATIEGQARPLLTPVAGAQLGPAHPSSAAALSRSTTTRSKPPARTRHRHSKGRTSVAVAAGRSRGVSPSPITCRRAAHTKGPRSLRCGALHREECPRRTAGRCPTYWL
ncbi:zeta toxin family protein [Streptomyces rochei]|uniref:zeta toxin family protein n=1 Tax=Streptomyces rochei TaxID=1928 RepID=UPI0033B207FE